MLRRSFDPGCLKNKPAWAVLARDDKSITPEIPRKMY
jgi:hypothetical protein